MRHKKWAVLGLLAMLLLPGSTWAQAVFIVPLPVSGFGSPTIPYRSYGPSYPPSVASGLGTGAGILGFGNNAAASNLALYNPLRYNAAFVSEPYNPTPADYNPLLYNAAFNPTLAPSNTAYAAAEKSVARKEVQPAAGTAAPDRHIRPAALDMARKPARIHMTLPTADAVVTLEGVTMKQTGRYRLFFTPRLEPGSKYSYDIVVRWRDAGKDRSVTRHVSLRAGQDVLVNLRGKNSP